MSEPVQRLAPHPIAGLAEIAGRYDAVVLDLWGCVHNGVRPFPGACDAMRRLRAGGKKVIILSNAPRRAAAVASGMAKLGVGGEFYDAVLSSGEVAWRALAERSDPWHARLGHLALHLGPPRDLSLFAGNGVERAPVDRAEFVLATGPNEDHMSVDDHQDVLTAAAARRLPMVCANPDLDVIRGEARLICAGALAQRYELLGGDVRYHGKPHASVYDATFALLDGVVRTRIVAIGDGIRTDILGANRAGIDSAFIAGGVHGEELGVAMGDHPDAEVGARLHAEYGASPTYLLPELRW
jgi:HAD superfamily hydrolase (TIGR01459 family)